MIFIFKQVKKLNSNASYKNIKVKIENESYVNIESKTEDCSENELDCRMVAKAESYHSERGIAVAKVSNVST